MLKSLLAFFGFGPDPKTSVACVRKSPADTKAAIVFVHGFTGSGATTWTELLPRIEAQANLEGWDIYTVTYATSLSLDISELWAADANLKTLGQRLATDLAQTALAPYDALVLIAHSMGGLVVQKALVDYPTLVRRTRCVILLGTPSDGLKKSSGAASLLKRQLGDMAWGSPFITALRADWQATFGDRPPFSFLASPASETSSSLLTPRLRRFRWSSRRLCRAIMCRCFRRRWLTTISSGSSTDAFAMNRPEMLATPRCG